MFVVVPSGTNRPEHRDPKGSTTKEILKLKLYKTKTGVIIEKDQRLHLLEGENWDTFVNDDSLFNKLAASVREVEPI